MNPKDDVCLDEAQSETKKNYETPCIVEERKMTFPKEVWNEFCNGKWCFGCTNCSCR